MSVRQEEMKDVCERKGEKDIFGVSEKEDEQERARVPEALLWQLTRENDIVLV